VLSKVAFVSLVLVLIGFASMHPLNIFGDGGGGAGVSVFQRMTVYWSAQEGAGQRPLKGNLICYL
jgi:hypothetical protein